MLTPQSGPAEQVGVLNRLAFDELRVRSSADLSDPCNLLLSAVLTRREGYCVGLAALYLVVAQEVRIPVYAVATPNHVFLRYDDGTTRINMETTAGGASRHDADYISEGRIAENSVRGGVFLRNLSEDRFLAQVHNNLGVVYSQRREFAVAEREYRRALDLDRRLAAAWYNWGNDLLRSGDYPRAIRVFTRSLKLHPTDVWAFNNRGMAYRKAGKKEKALRDFEAALRIEPGFSIAQENRDRTLTDSGSSQP